MTKSTFLLAVAFASLWRAQIGSAVPKPSNDTIRSLSKRNQVVFQDCGGDDDPKRVKAAGAWAEAANLAAFTISGTLDSGTQFQGSKAYSHYFEDADSMIVTNMFGNVQAGSSGDSGDGFQLTFIISCKETDNCADSFAVTDTDPVTNTLTPIIRLCPLFFTDPTTANNVDSKQVKRNPGRRDNSWCQPNQPFSFFETAGHTFLHEMTHLDQLGKVAGLSERDTTNPDIRTHGTDDIYDIAPGYPIGSPERAARRLKDNWTAFNKDNSKKKPELQRVENAESFAASATEFWFQSKCGWDTIEQ